MAMGKAPDGKTLKVSFNIEDQLWRAHIASEKVAAEAWKTKWGWILTEYEKLHDQLEEMSKNSFLPKPKSKPEHRTIKPIPNSTAHECGWLASRKEFALEKYGPDVYQGMPYVSLSGV